MKELIISNRMFITVHISLLLLFFIPAALTGQDYGDTPYSLLGEFSILAEQTDIDDETEHLAKASIYLDHQLVYSEGGFYIKHLVSYNENNPESIGNTVYEAFLELYPHSSIVLVMGKQFFSVGDGIFFNPFDTINPPSQSLDINAHREGFWGTAVQFYPNSDSAISMAVSIDDVINSDKDIDESGLIAKADYFWGNLKTSATLAYQLDHYGIGGFGLSYNLFDFIVFNEAGIEFENEHYYPEADDSSVSWSEKNSEDYFINDYPLIEAAGFQRSIYMDDFTLGFIGEYLFREASYTKEQTSDFFTAMALGQFPPLIEYSNTGRQHLFGNISLDYDTRLTLDNSLLLNIEDQSFINFHSLLFSYFENIDLELVFTQFHGKDDSEFGSPGYAYILDFAGTVHF